MKQTLTVEGRGLFVHREQDTVIVEESGEKKEVVSVSKIDSIVIIGSSAAISTGLIQLCAERDVPIIFLDGLHRVVAQLHSPRLRRSVRLSEAQQAFRVTPQAISFVCRLLAEKIQRQHLLINYHARSRRLSSEKRRIAVFRAQPFLDAFASVEKSGDSLPGAVNHLFLIEARAAARYWAAFAKLLPDGATFAGRVHRGADDPANSLLNYGYAILSSTVLTALLKARLDPSVGLLHHRRASDYPLLYDLIEPFRPFVEHTVLECLNRQRRPLTDAKGVVRQALFRRFRARWAENAKRPEPWGRRGLSLPELIEKIMVDFKTDLGC